MSGVAVVITQERDTFLRVVRVEIADIGTLGVVEPGPKLHI